MKICKICGKRMVIVKTLGKVNADYVCINPVCGIQKKTCPICGKQVAPKSRGLGDIIYTCECGNELK